MIKVGSYYIPLYNVREIYLGKQRNDGKYGLYVSRTTKFGENDTEKYLLNESEYRQAKKRLEELSNVKE